MTRNQIAAKLRTIAAQHRQVRTAKVVKPDYFLDNEDKDVLYPAVWVTMNDVSVVEKQKTVSVILTIADIIHHPDTPHRIDLEVQSDMEQVADDLISQIAWGKHEWIYQRNSSYTYFVDSFGDEVAGLTVNIDLALPFVYDACDLPSNYELPSAAYVYISPDRFRTIADFIVSSTSPIVNGGTTYQSNLFTQPPFVFINGQLLNYEPNAFGRYLSFSGTTVTIENGGVITGEHVFIITDSISLINTNRFMTVVDFIVGTGEPMEDGDTTYTDNQLVVPPFVFIDGQLLGYTITTDRRYVSHNATTKTITINNGGVLDGESVRVVI